MVPAAMAGRQIVQWDKDSCADAGFLKIDLLGLGMLSRGRALRRADRPAHTASRSTSRASRSTTRRPSVTSRKRDTTGVFQIESRAQMGSLRRTRPATLKDLTVQVALVRPGPIVGGAVNPYIERRQRLRRGPRLRGPVPAPVPARAARRDARHDHLPGPGDRGRPRLRRVHRRRGRGPAPRDEPQALRGGDREPPPALHRGRPAHPPRRRDEPVAEQVWTMVRGFAGFGFPKAHGAAFGLLAYQSTWLRVHYPAEFLCALLNEQPMGFYPPDSLIHEAQRRGVQVLAPDVNHSEAECTVTEERRDPARARLRQGHPRSGDRAPLASRRGEGAFRSLGGPRRPRRAQPRRAGTTRLVGSLRRARRRWPQRTAHRALAARGRDGPR